MPEKRQLISRMLAMISLRASRPAAKRVTRVRFCCMAVAASNPSINGNVDIALSACAAIRLQRSAAALINRQNAVCKDQAMSLERHGETHPAGAMP
jgi:hypothetical protein